MSEIDSMPADRDAAMPLDKGAGSLWAVPVTLQLWHLVSLDAPTVAVVWSLAFAWACGLRLPYWTVATLALTVWAIYVADRFLDARRAIAENRLTALRERHFYHWRYRRILVPLAVAASVAAGCIVLFKMPAAIFERDSVVAAAALLYFRGVHLSSAGQNRPAGALSRVLAKIRTQSALRFPIKELLVGLLFTAGCALPAWNRSRLPLLMFALPAGLFSALAWLNCFAIDQWESEPRKSRVAPFACVLSLTAASISMLLASDWPLISSLLVTCAASALLLALLDRMRNRMTPLALRATADLVLLTPLALLLR